MNKNIILATSVAVSNVAKDNTINRVTVEWVEV